MSGNRTLKIPLKPGKSIMTLMVLLSLYRIPRSFLGFPYIYSIEYSARTLANQTEIFGITIVEIITAILGFCIYTRRNGRKIRYWWILLTVAFVNLFRYLLGLSNPFELQSYEIYLAIWVAFSCGTIILYYYNSLEELEKFLSALVVISFASQIYFMLAGGFSTNGTYNGLGLPGGALAICYTIFILLKLLKEETGVGGWILIGTSLAGIVLTGSRTNLLLAVMFFGLYVAFYLKINSYKKWLYIGMIVASFVAISFSQELMAKLLYSEKMAGMLRIFSGGLTSYITNDPSAMERINTWRAAFEVIRDNPIGISCSVVDLQKNMYAAGSTTFPHSFLLAYYLLLGVPGLIIYIQFWRTLVASIKSKSRFVLLNVYLVLILTIFGGISTQYQLIFWLMIIFYIVNHYMNTDQEEQAADINYHTFEEE